MTNTAQPLSRFLQLAAAKDEKIPRDLLQRANQMPTPKLQKAYLERFSEERARLFDRLDAELLSGKPGVDVLYDSRQSPTAPSTAAPTPAPLPSASAIAKGGLETFLSSIKFRFFEQAWRNLGGVAFDAWDAVDEMWKRWSIKRKILVGAAMLFFLSGFGVFHAIGVPFVWLYHHWHMPFVTSAERGIRNAEDGSPPRDDETQNASKRRSESKLSQAPSPRQSVSRGATHQAPDRSVSGPETSTPLNSPLTTAGNDGKGKSSFITSFAKQLVKNSDTVVATAIPMYPLAEGINAAKNAAVSAEVNPPNPPLQKGGEGGFHLVPIPQNLKWKKNSNENSILLAWKNMGPEYHYNLYASYANDHPAYDRDGSLFRDPAAIWTPPAQGEQVFLLYVTAVNGSGEESEPSQRVLVDLR